MACLLLSPGLMSAAPPSPTLDPAAPRPFWRRERWQLAGAGFVLGVLYTALAVAADLEIRLARREVTLLVGALIELSFAAWGFLLGATLEARRRERATAARLQEQTRHLAGIRARLAESEKLASLGELAGAIAHEVRNPLAILRSMSQNLTESVEDREVERTCNLLIEEIDRLSRVTSSLLDLAKPMALQRSRVAVREILERTELLARPMLAARDVTLDALPAPGGEQALEVDPDLVCQVLLELLSNAAEATAAGGSVRLEARVSKEERGGRFDCTVTDDGPGIPESSRDRIFEPFFTTGANGHGLGLAVARRIAEAHGGTLRLAESMRAGGAHSGASFVLGLPLQPGGQS